MAHKTFISYKYSEAKELRDSIIKSLGDNATYYNGESSDSPDLTDNSTETIKQVLRDMMYDTSVTIVIISPNMTQSKWIDWEIEYSLKRVTRAGRTSQTNGVVGVVMKHNGDYSWFQTLVEKSDGCKVTQPNESKVYSIISENRYNQTPKVYACDNCKCISALTGSYISYITEDDFMKEPTKYIDNAYDKSENDASGYSLTRSK